LGDQDEMEPPPANASAGGSGKPVILPAGGPIAGWL
jgi:hypothetical protein